VGSKPDELDAALKGDASVFLSQEIRHHDYKRTDRRHRAAK
jgi:hypothetical protein